MTETTENQAQKADQRGARKERRGVVVRAKAQKTVVVEVRRRVRHAKYKKFIFRRTRYSVDDQLGCSVGDVVRIRETRPISKTKRWKIVERLSRGSAS